MPKGNFRGMTKERQLEVARLGGMASALSGKAHRWTRQEASIAGKLGGKRSQENRRRKKDELHQL